MQKLLALHNIGLVTLPLNDGDYRQYAFTPKMIANRIFIEFKSDAYAAQDTIADLAEDEDDEALANENVLAEAADENEDDLGTHLSVLIEYNKSYYLFTMFHNADDLSAPILLAQTIIFLASLCEKYPPEQLLGILHETCVEPLIPDEIEDRQHRHYAKKLISTKIQMAMQLISEENSDLN